MRAFVIHGPRRAAVEEVPDAVATPGNVVVDVQRAGICGTDVELYTGEMQYLHDGNASYPLRIGHEWMGVISSVGAGIDASWVGRRVTGDTMIGCGQCYRCLNGRHHVCEYRFELGIRGGMPGALAEQLVYPARYLHPLPDAVDNTAGALVEPAGNALRSVWASHTQPGERLLVLGMGTIGLLVALFGRAAGLEVHVMGRRPEALDFTRSLGFDTVWTEQTLPDVPWDAVVDASNAPHLPGKAIELVEPGKNVVYIGLSGTPSMIDTRSLALKDLTAVGILGASQGLDGAIGAFADGSVKPDPLVGAVVGLDDVADVLGGNTPAHAGPGPKTHISFRG